MSHITKVETWISDKEALLETLAELGHECEERCTIYYEGRMVTADVAVRRKGRFSIGFLRREEGNVYEMHAFGLSRSEVRAFHDRLYQRYARKKLLKEARKQNFVLVHEKVYEDSRIRLVLRKAG
jgi:hypothetical protein